MLSLVCRDRENASVIVAGLPSDATEQDVRTLFRDCGDIAEVFGPKVLGEAGAAVSVEFASRVSESAFDQLLRASLR